MADEAETWETMVGVYQIGTILSPPISLNPSSPDNTTYNSQYKHPPLTINVGCVEPERLNRKCDHTGPLAASLARRLG